MRESRALQWEDRTMSDMQGKMWNETIAFHVQLMLMCGWSGKCSSLERTVWKKAFKYMILSMITTMEGDMIGIWQGFLSH